MRQQQARERQQRKRNLARYIPDVSRAVYEVLDAMADGKRRRTELPLGDAALLAKIASEEVTEETLQQRLTQHVEQVRGPGGARGGEFCFWVVSYWLSRCPFGLLLLAFLFTIRTLVEGLRTSSSNFELSSIAVRFRKPVQKFEDLKRSIWV